MQTDITPPRGPVDRLLRREAARWWWVPLVSGVLWLIIAWLVLRANVTSLGTVGVLVGVVLVVAAVSEIGLAGLVSGGWAVMHGILAVLFLLGGLWAFIRPIDTFFALASVLGLLLFLEGAFYVTRSIAMREISPYWWVGLIGGSLFILLAIWMSTSDRVWNLAGRTVFILAAVGIYAVFRGISDIGLAFDLRHFGREARRPEPEPAAPPASFPAQSRGADTAAEPSRAPGV
jgi:uncharacterized membrane protein HdeD (DUF308 family)